ncbi:MAG: hypothetical protein HW421_1026 [Ignavibacteria bacterium]|nr:hypothetical protein [Ignavibacteria bacterium]
MLIFRGKEFSIFYQKIVTSRIAKFSSNGIGLCKDIGYRLNVYFPEWNTGLRNPEFHSGN